MISVIIIHACTDGVLHLNGEMEVFEDAGIYNFCVSLESAGSVEIDVFDVFGDITNGTAGIR